jgi:hypothetical protein
MPRKPRKSQVNQSERDEEQTPGPEEILEIILKEIREIKTNDNLRKEMKKELKGNGL